MSKNKFYDFYNKKYLENNKSLSLEDTFFKVNLIIRMIDNIILKNKKKNFDVMDIGCGSGIVLHILKIYYNLIGIKFNCYSNDLSSNVLYLTKNNFPETNIIKGDIVEINLKKKFDIILAIDFIEHVPQPDKYIKKISKITDYAIFKTPLEDAFFLNFKNKITNNSFKKNMKKKVGHINIFNIVDLHNLLTDEGKFQLEKQFYADVFNFELSDEFYRRKNKFRRKLYLLLGKIFYKISPRLSASLFCDFSIDLVNYKSHLKK